MSLGPSSVSGALSRVGRELGKGAGWCAHGQACGAGSAAAGRPGHHPATTSHASRPPAPMSPRERGKGAEGLRETQQGRNQPTVSRAEWGHPCPLVPWAWGTGLKASGLSQGPARLPDKIGRPPPCRQLGGPPSALPCPLRLAGPARAPTSVSWFVSGHRAPRDPLTQEGGFLEAAGQRPCSEPGEAVLPQGPRLEAPCFGA